MLMVAWESTSTAAALAGRPLKIPEVVAVTVELADRLMEPPRRMAPLMSIRVFPLAVRHPGSSRR